MAGPLIGEQAVGLPVITEGPDLHTHRLSVYLDQWVWLRLAKADIGEPREDADTEVLAAVRRATAGGVAFPLSATHYMETSRITSPQRRGVLGPDDDVGFPGAAPGDRDATCFGTRCCTRCT